MGDVAAGTAESLYLRARATIDTTMSDTGFADVLVVRFHIATTKAVDPSGTELPGTDLTYTGTLTNTGTDAALDATWVDSLAEEVEFKVGSVVTSFPTGIGVVVECSDDDGADCACTPISEGCGASVDYDACVTDIRWTLGDPLPASAPDNTGTMEYVARIK